MRVERAIPFPPSSCNFAGGAGNRTGGPCDSPGSVPSRGNSSLLLIVFPLTLVSALSGGLASFCLAPLSFFFSPFTTYHSALYQHLHQRLLLITSAYLALPWALPQVPGNSSTICSTEKYLRVTTLAGTATTATSQDSRLYGTQVGRRHSVFPESLLSIFHFWRHQTAHTNCLSVSSPGRLRNSFHDCVVDSPSHELHFPQWPRPRFWCSQEAHSETDMAVERPDPRRLGGMSVLCSPAWSSSLRLGVSADVRYALSCFPCLLFFPIAFLSFLLLVLFRSSLRPRNGVSSLVRLHV